MEPRVTIFPPTYSPIISPCHSLSHEFSVNQSSPPPPTYSPITSPCHSLSPSDSVSPTNPPDVITLSQNQFNKNFEIPDLHHITKHDNLPPLLHEILPKSDTYIFQKIDISTSNLVCSVTLLRQEMVQNNGLLIFKTKPRQPTESLEVYSQKGKGSSTKQ